MDMVLNLIPQGVPLSKRIFDILSSLVVGIILLPIYLVLAFIVLLDLGTPVFFQQERPGYKGKPMRILKFRTMRDPKPGEEGTGSDKIRLTRFGAFLRSTSLDELPELFCVLKGEMSVVGPRPLLTQYLPLYSPEQMQRHNVLPGLTGWAQINGRNALSWEDKFKLDVWYVDHWSFWLDMKIIFLSIWKVLKREGISQVGEVTAREWTGNRED
jgi:sugar transferase EpsL